jgi:crotonobetainyl-CoA:carnitine CoA-transferase CaiB-like acyl-CoA transferase
MALIGILAALAGRSRNGQGAFLDISMLDAAIGWTGVQMSDALARAYDPSSTDKVEGWGGNARYNIYRTRDGRHLTVSLLEKHFWIAFCRHVGREDLIDPTETEADRLTSHGDRGELYRSSLTEIFATRDRDDWATEMAALGIPICPVLSPDEVYASAPAAERGWFMDVAVPGFGRPVPQPGFPFVMQTESRSGFAVRRPPPQLGEANGALGEGSIWPARGNE